MNNTDFNIEKVEIKIQYNTIIFIDKNGWMGIG